MTRLAFDIETDGLLPDVSTTHCLVLKDLDKGKVWSASSKDRKDLEEGLKYLQAADYIVGHNIVGYDLPVLKHLYPWFAPRGRVRDTLIMAKMIWPVDRLRELDFPRWRKGTLPGQLIGAHKLEAWGYRMGHLKDDYSKVVATLSKEFSEHGDVDLLPDWAKCLATVDARGKPSLNPWASWNQNMQDYCVVDVEVTESLHNLIQGHLDGTGKAAQGVAWSERSVEIEHRVWSFIRDQEERGYGFDKAEAIKLASTLKTRQAALEAELVGAFGSWWAASEETRPARAYSEKATQFPDVTIRRVSEKTGKELKAYVGPPLIGYSPDAPFVRITRTTFNPKSRQHLGERLQSVFGWTPQEWVGKNGDQAKVDETTLKTIPDDVLPTALRELILEFLVVSKTLGQLADGNKAWIELCSDDGRLRGRMDTLGTVSHRAAHMNPNLGQVPSVTKVKVDGVEVPVQGWKGGFGLETRALFGPRPGWFQTGVDCSGLELRLLGHYLTPYDGGAFGERVSTPGLDIHAENAKITGLSRADTKTVTYAFLYGAGPLKIGLGVGVPEEDIEALGNSSAAKNYVTFIRRVQGAKFIQPDVRTLAHVVRGQQVKKAFLEGITGLKDFQKDTANLATAQGFLVALDGRKLFIRKDHASVNQLLQGGGAIVCKEWIMETDRILSGPYSYTPNRDYGQMAFIHDEAQYEARTESIAKDIIVASQESVQNVAKSLNFQGKLATEGKIGRNWRDCH